jgi:hypothetical protein
MCEELYGDRKMYLEREAVGTPEGDKEKSVD